MATEISSAVSSLPLLPGSGSLPDQVAALLKQSIIEGDLQPGQRLNGDELAQHFQVSRIPVREALRSLQASGWVHIEPRHGVYVRTRDAVEFRNLFEVRLVLEDYAVRVAADRRTEQQLAELTRLVELGRQAVDDSDSKQINTVNTLFHEALVRCAGNDVLSDVLKGLSELVYWYYSVVSDERGSGSMEEHAAIVAAVREQDSNLAASLIRRHIETTRAAVERVAV